MLALNCNLTKMSVIDINGVLSFFDLEAKGGAPGTQGEHLAFERKVRGRPPLPPAPPSSRWKARCPSSLPALPPLPLNIHCLCLP